MYKRVLTVVAGGAAIFALAGCTSTVPASSIAKEVTSQMGQYGTVTGVTCPNDLDATVGKSETCTGQLNGSSASFSAKIATVNGNTVTLTVDTLPGSGGGSTSQTTTGSSDTTSGSSDTTTGDTSSTS